MTTESRHFEHRKEVHRKRNLEDVHPWIANAFFCYFFPLVCRFSPLTDTEMPEACDQDRALDCHAKLKKEWDPKYEKYVEQMNNYEEKKKNSPQFYFTQYYSSLTSIVHLANN